MNKEDEHIQRAIEVGSEPIGNRHEIAAYQEIFSRLRNQPELKITSDLENIVLAKVIKRRQQHSRRDYIWLGLGIFSLFIAFIVAIALSNFILPTAMVTGISNVTGLIIFGITFVVILNYMDKSLLKKADQIEL